MKMMKAETMIRSTAAALVFLALSASASMAAEIVIHDEKSQPESMAAAPDGTLYVGSAGSPYIYSVKKGATTAEQFVDASAEGPGTFFFGQLVEGDRLWACLLTPLPGQTVRKSSLHGYDLKTGAETFRWDLPGASSVCNDFAVGPDKALYITDTGNAKIYRLAPGAKSAELFLDHRLMAGVDGITFLNGALYVNSVFFNNLYRIPIDAAGKAGAPVEIWMDAPVRGPDGMRAANGKLLVAENAAGKITALTVTGDTAHVTVLKEGLKTPTGVEPAGDVLWATERGTGKVLSIPTPK